MKNGFILLALFLLLNIDVGMFLLYGKYKSKIDNKPATIAELTAEPDTWTPIGDFDAPRSEVADNIVDVDIVVDEPIADAVEDPNEDVSDEPTQDPVLEEDVTEEPAVRYAPANFMLADLSNFRQDERGWAYDPLGHTNQTMREFGCTVTSVANAITNYDRDFITPRILNNNLIKAQGYTNRGWLKWSAISQATDGKYSARVFNSPSNANIDSCLLSNEYPVVKIMLRGTVQHWVLIVGKSNGEYLIRDPLEGDRAEAPMLLSERAERIHSLRCIKRN